MIYYLIPRDRSAAVRIGCRLVSVLIEAGLPAVTVTSSGRAPQWFPVSVAVISSTEAAGRARQNDWIVSCGRIDEELEIPTTNRVLHCLRDEDCRYSNRFASRTEIWVSAPGMLNGFDGALTSRVRDVGMHVHREFFYDGTEIVPNMICTRSSASSEFEKCRQRGPDWLQWVNLDSIDEPDTAMQLKRGSFYLSPGGPGAAFEELEAMAAGCIVLRRPTEFDQGYARPGENCVHFHGSEPATALEPLTGPLHRSSRERLRYAAMATAAQYTRRAQVRWLRRSLLTVTSKASN